MPSEGHSQSPLSEPQLLRFKNKIQVAESGSAKNEQANEEPDVGMLVGYAVELDS